MSVSDGMPVNFIIAEAAKAEIAKMKRHWNENSADPADIVAIAWGTTLLHSGQSSDGVVVSFYGKSERRLIEHGIERTSGLEIVFFITQPDYHRFSGQTLDFSASQGFYLRP